MDRTENWVIETIAKVCGAILAVAAVTALGRKAYCWLRPATAAISYQLVLDGSRPDSITVAVTNRSSSAIYLRSCTVRSTHPLRRLVALHLEHPFLRPRFYPNLRYNGCVYEFVKGEPVQLAPAQLKELTLAIHEHPLNAIYGPMLIARAELTTGQVVRSKRIPSPQVWRMIGSRGR